MVEREGIVAKVAITEVTAIPARCSQIRPNQPIFLRTPAHGPLMTSYAEISATTAPNDIWKLAPMTLSGSFRMTTAAANVIRRMLSGLRSSRMASIARLVISTDRSVGTGDPTSSMYVKAPATPATAAIFLIGQLSATGSINASNA